MGNKTIRETMKQHYSYTANEMGDEPKVKVKFNFWKWLFKC
jgi:hypothetical protein